MDEASDARLLAAIRAGAPTAWRQAVERWAAPVYVHLLHVTGDTQAAYQMTVEAFQLAADSLPAVSSTGTLRAHFFGSAWQTLRREQVAPAIQHRALADLHILRGLSEAEVAQALHLSAASAAVLVGRLQPAPGGAPEAAAALPVGLVEQLIFAAPAAAPLRRIGAPPPPASAVAVGVASWPLFAGFAFLAVLAAALFVPGSPLALVKDDGGALPAAPSGTPSATPATPTRTASATTRPSATASASATTPATATRTGSPSATGTARPSATVGTPTPVTPQTAVPSTPTPSRTPTPTATLTPTLAPSPTPTATPCSPRIFVELSPQGINVVPGGSIFVFVFNSFCGAATLTVTVSDGRFFRVTPAEVAVGPGGNGRLTVFADPPAEPGTYTTTLRITGPANTLDIPVSSTRQ